MKYLLILFTATSILAACSANVDTGGVPSLVLNSFSQQFPAAKDVEWDIENNLFNVEFEIRFKDHEAWYDSTGTLLKHEQEISRNDLPSTIGNHIKNKFSGFRIDKVKKIEEGSTTTYRVEIEKIREERILVFSASGDLLQNIPD